MLGNSVVHVGPKIVLQKAFFCAGYSLVARQERGMCGVDNVIGEREGEEQNVSVGHVVAGDATPKNVTLEKAGGGDFL
jgi:hypothetical protein